MATTRERRTTPKQNYRALASAGHQERAAAAEKAGPGALEDDGVEDEEKDEDEEAPAPTIEGQRALVEAEAEGLQLERSATNTTGYKGVSKGGKGGRRFFAVICGNGRQNLGSFDTPEEAALAYARAVQARRALHGPWPRLIPPLPSIPHRRRRRRPLHHRLPPSPPIRPDPWPRLRPSALSCIPPLCPSLHAAEWRSG